MFKWLVKFYENTLPEAEICIGHSSTKQFSRSLAINNAARKASGEVFVIVDADIICNPYVIRNAVNTLKHSTWIIPYTNIEDIYPISTKKLLTQTPKWPLPPNIKSTKRFKGSKNFVSFGGINILKRESFYSVEGFDERFIGWGGEDDAFRCAMNTICGDFIRIDQNVFHLWHPPAKARSNPNYNNNVNLALRYCNSSGDITAMQKLIKESKSFKISKNNH
ncbi:galactosyltransferase-related protein [Rossellomorea sp. YZS02]|uniref:galactosyltransferase-related protein n=1 Tax=Rossellomorea sp. YZS02 TaxID=3097358 RepID=UPI002A0B66C0|nr:galactosyltransferase-related protein [Rossellomorea sp. YZS02]MDX8343978.1 galactosyltransferase-related protein [Rossellomorea sp. YZS02]